MHRTHAEILRGLDPHDPATIQRLIEHHRRTLGGFVMVDGAAGGEPSGGNGGQPAGSAPGGDHSGGQGGQGANGDGGDEPLGANGVKALHAERDARKALEQQLQQFKTEQAEQAKKLAEAFGITPKDAKSGTGSDEVVAALQQQMADLQHSNLVYQLAGEHKITDQGDVAILLQTRDQDAVKKLAARLAPKDDAGNGSGSGSGNGNGKRPPKQDPSQGRGGDGQPKPGEAGRAEADRRFKKTTQQ